MTPRPPQGISLSIGVNQLDPAHYVGMSRQLFCCERDAQAMQYVADRSGLAPLPTLLGDRATFGAVLSSIAHASADLEDGDFFLITFAGHGAQVPDITGTERDGRNETWCLYDQELVDHQLFAATRSFRPGVRVLIVSDCCHSGIDSESLRADGRSPSGLASRDLPREVADNVYRQHPGVYDTQVRLGSPARRRSALTANVLMLASCRADELSYEGASLGLFTNALVQAWDEGGFIGGYDELLDRISTHTPRYQTPNLSPVSEDNPGLKQFRESLPFLVGV